MLVEDSVSLHAALLSLAFKCYIDRTDYVDKVRACASPHTSRFCTARSCSWTSARLSGRRERCALTRSLEPFSAVSKELVKLLKTCSAGYRNIQQSLALQHFVPLFQYLSNDTRRDMALALLETVCSQDTRLDDVDHVSAGSCCVIIIVLLF